MGTVVCKMGEHRHRFRGYIAMLVVIKPYRGKGIGIVLRFWFTIADFCDSCGVINGLGILS